MINGVCQNSRSWRKQWLEEHNTVKWKFLCYIYFRIPSSEQEIKTCEYILTVGLQGI